MHDVIVANGVWHGGGMKLAPDAQPDDGLFDVVLIGDVGKVDFLTTAPKIYKGKHVTHPKVEVLRSARVEVDAAEHLPIEVEGEQVGTTPAASRSCPAPCACASRPERISPTFDAWLARRLGGVLLASCAVVLVDAAGFGRRPRASRSASRAARGASPSPRARGRASRGRRRGPSAASRPGETRDAVGFCDALPSTSSPSEARWESGFLAMSIPFPGQRTRVTVYVS